jgi:hypothetical protein
MPAKIQFRLVSDANEECRPGGSRRKACH